MTGRRWSAEALLPGHVYDVANVICWRQTYVLTSIKILRSGLVSTATLPPDLSRTLSLLRILRE